MITSKNWCYVCQKEFDLTGQSPRVCPTCKQDAFEQVTPQSHPQLFRAYQPSTNPQSQQPQQQQGLGQQPINLQTQLVQPFMSLTSIFANTYQTMSNNYRQNPQSLGSDPSSILQNSINQSFAHLFTQLPQIMGLTNQISNFLMQNLINSGQSYRPATSAEIAALPKVEKVKDCAICQQPQNSTSLYEGYKLACGHEFHVECLGPWFQRANTCPTCRQVL